MNNINAKLRGTKTLDIFQPARIDPNFTVEDQMKTLATLQKEGKFGHIGLSECSAASVRRANAVSLNVSFWRAGRPDFGTALGGSYHIC